MMQVTAVGSSHVGRSRHGRANEDSYHVGDSAFAVADGMGGHLAGEVASAMALDPVTELDGRIFPDSNEALRALRDAVLAANIAVIDKATQDVQLRGMGTTLTAVIVEGRRAHIAHVGDSRAYLLRNGVFSQLTTDHTLVQRLLDDGRITKQQAAEHPQRSVITRAIGVERQIDIDAMTLELVHGDRLLLCSDGLSGPVTDQALGAILSQPDLERIPDELIAAANDAGGPDNITAVVLDAKDANPDGAAQPAATQPSTPIVVNTTAKPTDQDWAGRLGHIGNLSPDNRTSADGLRRSWTPLIVLALVAALVSGGFVVGRALLERSWFVGVDQAGAVIIYRGLPGDFGPLDLAWEQESTSWVIDEVPPLVRDEVRDGLAASDLQDARRIVENFDNLADTPDPTSSLTPSERASTPGLLQTDEPATSPSPQSEVQPSSSVSPAGG